MTGLVAVPTSEVVAVAWASAVVRSPVATTLPDAAGWVDTGFVQVSGVFGTPAPYYALNRPVVTFDCWASNTGSTKPPWGKAAALAAALEAATYGARGNGVELVLPRGLGAARVLSVWPVKHPQRVLGDVASFARYTIDLSMVWAAA